MKARISGLYAVTPDLHETSVLLAQTAKALAGGVRWLQYRNKAAGSGLRREQAVALQQLCARHDAALIINDDIDLARELDTAGVHVGAADAAVSAARTRLGAGKIIGASCYNEIARVRAASVEGADYVALGSFFASGIKPAAVRAPVALIAEARLATSLPVVAIGGITLSNAWALVDAGVDAIAVISGLFGTDDIETAARNLNALFDSRHGYH